MHIKLCRCNCYGFYVSFFILAERWMFQNHYISLTVSSQYGNKLKLEDISKKVISFHHLCGFCFIQTRVVDAFVIKYVNGYYREAAEEERKADLSLSLRLSGIQNKNCIYSTFLWQKFENMSPKSFCVCLFI